MKISNCGSSVLIVHKNEYEETGNFFPNSHFVTDLLDLLGNLYSILCRSAVKMRKSKVDPVALYESERGSKSDPGQSCNKDLLNLVVVGHVDSGKSTLMGHLLVELGQVSSRVMHKYESESK